MIAYIKALTLRNTEASSLMGDFDPVASRLGVLKASFFLGDFTSVAHVLQRGPCGFLRP